MILATDRSQCKTIFRYALALLKQVPALAPLVAKETEETIILKNNVTIEIATASYRGVRGRTVICAILDECSFFRSDESANPDREVLDAILPAMATIPNAMLLCVSSLYAKKGIMWESFKENYANDTSSALFWRAPTRTMNPLVPQSVIDAAMRRDEAVARSEYLSEFRQDLSPYVSPEAVAATVVPGRLELPPAGHNYVAFCDPAGGGGGGDAMTIAVAHLEEDIAVLDAVRFVSPPFSPEDVVAEFSALLGPASYGITRLVGDRFAGGWVKEAFAKHNLVYELSAKSKGQIYIDFLPMINSRRVSLLDIPRISTEILSLERRAARGGKDIVDHSRNCHDDVANSCAGALLLAIEGKAGGFNWSDEAIDGLMSLAF